MLTTERREKILRAVLESGAVRTSQLSRCFSVSEITIRNDLNRLEQDGLLVRVHGGAMRGTAAALDAMYRERASRYMAEKAAIGAKAAQFVSNDSTLFLAPGSTVRQIIPHLRTKTGLRVLTNSMHSAHALVEIQSVETTIVGGALQRGSFTMAGPLAARFLEGFFVDQLYMSIDCISIEAGLTNFSVEQAEIYKAVRRIAGEAFVLADHSKFGSRSHVAVFGFPDVDRIITDSNLDDEYASAIRALGVELVVV